MKVLNANLFIRLELVLQRALQRCGGRPHEHICFLSRVSAALTNADRTGTPSAEDLSDMKLSGVANSAYPNKSASNSRATSAKNTGRASSSAPDDKKVVSLPQIAVTQSSVVAQDEEVD